MTYDNSFFLLGTLGAEQPLSNNEVEMQTTVEDIVQEKRLPGGVLKRYRPTAPLLHWQFHYSYLPGKSRDVFDGGLSRDALFALYAADAVMSFFEPNGQGSWNTYFVRFAAGSWQQKIAHRYGDFIAWDVQFELVQSQPGPLAMNYSAVILRESGLLRYYRLGEASGTIAADSSVYAQGGTYAGTVGYSQAGALSGDPNTAINFDGTTTYVTIPPMITLQNSSYTFECWLKPSGTVALTRYILNTYSAITTNNIISLLYATTNRVVLFGGSSISSPNNVVINNVYNYLVGTFDVTTNTGTLYVNGLQVAQGVNSALKLTSTPTQGYLGTVAAGSQSLPGVLDEVAVYNRVLSANDVMRHWLAAPVNLVGV